MSDNLVGVVKLSKRESQMLEILKGMEPGASLVDWHKAVRASNIVTGKDGKPAKPDTVRKAFDRVRDALEKADAIEINGEMVTVNTSPGGEDMIFGTAEEEFADEGE